MISVSIRPIVSTLVVETYTKATGTVSTSVWCRAVITSATDSVGDADCRLSFKIIDDVTRSQDQLALPDTCGLVFYNRPGTSHDEDEDPGNAQIELWVSAHQFEQLIGVSQARVMPSRITAESGLLVPESEAVTQTDTGWFARFTSFTFVFGEASERWQPLRGLARRAYDKAIHGSKGNSEKSRLTAALAKSVQVWAEQEGAKGYDLKVALVEAFGLIDSLQEEMNPFVKYRDNSGARDFYQKKLSKYESGNDQTGWVWRSRRLRSAIAGGETDTEHWACGVEELSAAAHEYLSKPWATCAPLERLLVDCLVFQYGLEIALATQLAGSGLNRIDSVRLMAKRSLVKLKAARKTPSWTPMMTGVVGLGFSIVVGVGVGMAVGWWAGLFAFELLSISAAINFGIQQRAEEAHATKLTSVTEDMITAYEALQHRILSPRLLRERFVHLTNDGFNWPYGVLEIIEHAERRNSYRWDWIDP